MSLEKKLIKPESILIEQTALELAAVYYEAGRSSGLQSKHKNARLFAKANVSTFIPKAVDLLMDMLANSATPKPQRDAIMDAFLERANDEELSNIGIKAFENPFEFTSDKVIIPPPIIVNTTRIEEALHSTPILNKGSPYGKEN